MGGLFLRMSKQSITYIYMLFHNLESDVLFHSFVVSCMRSLLVTDRRITHPPSLHEMVISIMQLCTTLS